MKPPTEFQDRSQYKERMNALLVIDPRRTVVADLEAASSPVAADEAERVPKHARDLLGYKDTVRP